LTLKARLQDKKAAHRAPTPLAQTSPVPLCFSTTNQKQ